MTNRNYRLTLFSSLYFSQGAIMSYFLTFNILYLGEAGYSPADVGIFQAVLVLPFVLKIFLGMLSDRFNLFGMGHRKPYILIGLVGQVLILPLMANVVVSEGLGLFALLAFIGSVSMALYDTCTDGLALDTTPDNERGLVQGLMTGARAAGILIMLLIGGLIIERLGWRWMFYIVGVSALLPFALALAIHEDSSQMKRQAFKWSAFRAFGQTAVLLLAGLGFLYAVALDGVLTFLSDHLRQALLVSTGNIGLLVALSMVGRIIGALSNSWVTDRIGHRQSLFVAIAIASLACFGLAFVSGVWSIAVFGFLFGVAYGYYGSVYGAVAMDLCNPHISASMFAIFMMCINLGTVGGQALGGVLTESIGFNNMVLVMGVLNLANAVLVIALFRRHTDRVPSSA